MEFDTKQERNDAIVLMARQKYRLPQIAEDTETSLSTVRRVLTAAGVLTPGKRRKRGVSPQRLARVSSVANRLKKGQTVTRIAKHFGVSRMQVYHDKAEAIKRGYMPADAPATPN